MSLKNDLSGLKSKLDLIEGEFENKLKDVENKEKKFEKLDAQIEELLSKSDSLIKLNVGGKVYQTKLSTLLSIKDTLFTRIVNSYLDKNEQVKEIFFDRSFKQFDKILDYLRTKKICVKGWKKAEIEEFGEECTYYGINAIDDILNELKKEIVFVNFEASPKYSTAGTHKLEDLTNRNLTGGICVQSPYEITIELNYDHEFEKIEIGGYNGNSSAWYAGNGSGAKILTSVDKNKFVEVGTIPSNFGATIQAVTLKKSTARYIRFKHTSYLGVGYLKIFKLGE